MAKSNTRIWVWQFRDFRLIMDQRFLLNHPRIRPTSSHINLDPVL